MDILLFIIMWIMSYNNNNSGLLPQISKNINGSPSNKLFLLPLKLNNNFPSSSPTSRKIILVPLDHSSLNMNKEEKEKEKEKEKKKKKKKKKNNVKKDLDVQMLEYSNDSDDDNIIYEDYGSSDSEQE